MIEVRHLVKCYGSAAAVNDLSFQVAEGQIYGFLGPNGAGKSTTMNMLTGYISPTSGDILINGHDILEEPQEARRCIGYLPEIPPVYPDMTVYEYLSFAAQLKRLPKQRRRELVAMAMEQTGVAAVQNRLIKNLSKGYRQRTGLAQAILGFPPVIILDEPMVGLDPKQIIEIRELIRSLSQRHTVILSSHILSEVSAICDHIMIIDQGQLVASDTPENLIAMMRGTSALELTVRGRKEELSRLLAGMEELGSFQLTASQETGAWDVSLKPKGDLDLRETLFYRLADGRMPLLRMQYTHYSLEDVFLKLTQEHPRQEETPEPEYIRQEEVIGSKPPFPQTDTKTENRPDARGQGTPSEVQQYQGGDEFSRQKGENS